MRVRIALAVALLLAGCASPAQKFAEANRPLAEQGRLTWSTYYRGLYDAAANSTEANRGAIMQRANAMIEVAHAYESGQITADQFASIRRQAQAAQTADDDALRRQQAAIMGAALQRAGNSMAQSVTPYKIVQPQPLTQASLQLPAQPVQASTVTAFWTGKQQQVQTVTNQVGWNCEYNYAGNTFWRTFTSACPMSVQAR